jgi:hypothetical protein
MDLESTDYLNTSFENEAKFRNVPNQNYISGEIKANTMRKCLAQFNSESFLFLNHQWYLKLKLFLSAIFCLTIALPLITLLKMYIFFLSH